MAKCPYCENKLILIYKAIGGFPGHPHIHPIGYPTIKCSGCKKTIIPKEFLYELKKSKEEIKVLIKKYKINLSINELKEILKLFNLT